MEGSLARLTGGWAARLTRVLAHAEAAIDFVEEDLPAELEQAALGEAAEVAAEIAAALDDHHRGERLREGLSVVILGAPNRSEEHTSDLQSLMRISYAVFCVKKQKQYIY